MVEITSAKGENIEFSCSKPSTVIQKEPDKKTLKQTSIKNQYLLQNLLHDKLEEVSFHLERSSYTII